jgi:hypothetical protein
MRYIIAFVLALLIVIAGFAFVAQTRRVTMQKVAEAKAGAGADIVEQNGEVMSGQSNSAVLSDFGTELTPGELRRMQIADLLTAFGWILVPLVFVVCFGGAAFFKSKSQP